jgi:hypothetical protein
MNTMINQTLEEINVLPYSIFMLAEEAKGKIQLPTSSKIQIIKIENTKAKCIYRNEDDLPISENDLMLALSTFSGAFSFSQEGAARLNKLLISLLPANFKSIDSLVEVFDRKSSDWEFQFAKWVQSKLASYCESASREITKLQKSLIILRKEQDRIQRAFMSLEEFLAQNVRSSDVITFVAEPLDAFVSLRCQRGKRVSDTVEQLLPVSSHGLNAIDLYVKPSDVELGGVLSLSLTTIEDKEELAKWEVPCSNLLKGWNTFSLRSCNSSRPQSVRLQVSWKLSDIQDEPPVLGLSSLNPLPAYRVHVNGMATQVSSIAFRCRSFVPGLRAPRILGAHLPIDTVTARDSRPWILPQNFFALAKDVSRKVQAGKHMLVRSFDNDSKLLVHPKKDGITTALLEGVCTSNVERITGIVVTDNESATSIQYGMVLLAKGQKIKSEPTEKDLKSLGDRFSGWHTVKPMQKTQIHFFLPEPTQGGESILLMTSLGKDGSAENASATFLALEFFPLQVGNEEVQA